MPFLSVGRRAARIPRRSPKTSSTGATSSNTFDLDRTLINLNTGHHCSQPRIVVNAVKRYLDMENMAPVYYGGQLNRGLEPMRKAIADEFGCEADELAITRNASESLQILRTASTSRPAMRWSRPSRTIRGC
jgi:selenocysteine lyase/cysteine desulfurase